MFVVRHSAALRSAAVNPREFLLKMLTSAPLCLAVIRFPDGWRILAPNGRWGRFRYRVDAEEAALRLARKARAGGREVDVWVQDLCGRLEHLDAA